MPSQADRKHKRVQFLEPICFLTGLSNIGDMTKTDTNKGSESELMFIK